MDSEDPIDDLFAENRWMQRLRRAEQSASLGKIGPYDLIEEAGRGGQGVVYRARLSGEDSGDVALKRLLAGPFASDSHRRRFDREIRMARTLDHPGIVPVDRVEVIDEQPVLVMPWIDGVGIREWSQAIRESEVISGETAPRIIRVFLQVVEAIRYAHDQGVIHRDLKPSNILVDASGQPHILDFGMAQWLDQTGGSELTRSGFVGTPAYASPEQIQRGDQRVDGRTDLYALGVVLYELLAGQRPHQPRPTVLETLTAKNEERPVRPSALRSGLSDDLDTICQKLLEPEPAHRYRSAEALETDLRRHLDGRPILSTPPGPWQQAVKVIRRRRWPIALAASVVISSLVFGAFAWVESGKLRRQRDEANHARKIAEEFASRARVLEEHLLFEMLQFADQGDRGLSVSVGEVLKQASLRTDQVLREDPPLCATLHEVLGRVYLEYGEAGQASRHADRAWALRAEFLPPGHRDLARLISLQGGIALAQGRHEAAESLLRECLPHQVDEQQAGERVVTLSRLGKALLAQSRHEEAEQQFRNAIEIQRHAGDWGRAMLHVLRVGLGSAIALGGDPNAALPLLEESAHQLVQFLGSGSSRAIDGQIALATGYQELGRVDDALRVHTQIEKGFSASRASRHPPAIARAAMQHSSLLMMQGKSREAFLRIERAMDLFDSADDSNLAPYVTCGARLAQLSLEQAEFEEAERMAEEMLETGRELPPDHPALSLAADVLAQVGSFQANPNERPRVIQGDPSEAVSRIR